MTTATAMATEPLALDAPSGWPDSPMLAFDLETTGIDTTTARIVTATLIHIAPGTDPEITNWLADPGIEIPAEATAVHGISTAHAREHGRPADQVVVEVAREIEQAWAQGWPVIAYNASYDLSVLHHELVRHCGEPGLTLLTGPGEGVGPVIDPLVIDKQMHRFRAGPRKLVDTCAHYKIELVDAHTSAADALAAARLAWVLSRRFPCIAEMTLPELHAAQIKWYREQQQSFARYLRGKCAQEVLAEAGRLAGDGRMAKLGELPDLLARADAVDAEADGWPIRRTA